jgi:hypothetical protein
MEARILITTAGSGTSENVIRSLRAANLSLVIVGCHDDRFILKKSSANANHLLPPIADPRWSRALTTLVAAEKIDLVIPTTDSDVRAVSRLRRVLGRRVFLPQSRTIKICQDKYLLNRMLRAKHCPAPETYPVRDLASVEKIFHQFDRRAALWCRIRTGSGSMAALPVQSADQARAWIEYWRDMRAVAPRSFTLAEYLPGRDLSCQSLWKNGRLFLIKTYERLSYIGTGSQPSQVSSIAALAKTAFEPGVVKTCTRAIRALDRKASGVFCVDLREDVSGQPSITEINVGRFSSATNIFDLAGKHNMAVTYVRLALGDHVDLHAEYDVAADYYMVRDVDTAPRILHAAELFDGIEDRRS